MGFSMQNFRPFQSSSPVPEGGCVVVHKLWYAVWLVLRKLYNLARGILRRTSEVAFQMGRFGFTQKPYLARALRLLRSLHWEIRWSYEGD